MRRKALLIVASATIALAAAPLVSLGSARAATATSAAHWHIESLPSPAASNTQLPGAACPSATSCFAVGYTYPSDLSGGYHRLVEHWNGTAWSMVSTPAPPGIPDTFFNAVSCSSVSACTAVGYGNTNVSKPIIERWDGHAWSVETPASAAGRGMLNGIACPSATTCFAVGDSMTTSAPLLERWNAGVWSMQTMPLAAAGWDVSLQGVTCLSTVNCTAVGSLTKGFGAQSHAVIFRWNGTKWSSQTPQLPSAKSNTALWAVGCVSSSNCFAAGESYVGQPTPDGGRRLVEHWNGAAWSMVTTPQPNGQNVAAFIDAIACRVGVDCIFAGTYDGSSTEGSTLLERSKGAAFTIEATPNHGTSQFYGAACGPSGSCIAVGIGTSGSRITPLVERNP